MKQSERVGILLALWPENRLVPNLRIKRIDGAEIRHAYVFGRFPALPSTVNAVPIRESARLELDLNPHSDPIASVRMTPQFTGTNGWRVAAGNEPGPVVPAWLRPRRQCRYRNFGV